MEYKARLVGTPEETGIRYESKQFAEKKAYSRFIQNSLKVSLEKIELFYK